MMRLSNETTEELIDLLELIAAGSTAPTLPSRANAILVHVKLTGVSKYLRPPTGRKAERMARNAARREREERLARIAEVYPEAAAEARLAGTYPCVSCGTPAPTIGQCPKCGHVEGGKWSENEDVPLICAHGLSTDVPCMDCPPNAILTRDGRTIQI